MSYLLAGSGSLLGLVSQVWLPEKLSNEWFPVSAVLVQGFTPQHHQKEANSFPFQRLPPFLVPCPAWPQAHCQGHLSAISLLPLIHSHPTASGIPSPTSERNTSRISQLRSLALVIGIH